MRAHLVSLCLRAALAPLLVAGSAVAGRADSPQPALASGGFVGIAQRASGFTSPVDVVSAGDGSNRLFIVEQGGLIRIWTGGQVLATPFLDVSSLVVAGGEQGLLGLAFHPSYVSNGFFYVNYTRAGDGNTVVARYQVSSDPNVADSSSARILFVVQQPFANHNGGNLKFGPDGYLYIGLGDGGGADDPLLVAQDLSRRPNNQAFLGKMLRIDVDQNVNTPPYYGIPPTNPYTGSADPSDAIPDEIWARGLRNPWRYSFDRQTGDLYIGDVGQSTREEVDFYPAGSPGGANFGWSVLEGTSCHNDTPPGSCAAFLAPGGSVLPALEYGRTEGQTVFGGFVFRGRPTSQLLSGSYVFMDLGSGTMWKASRDNLGNWSKQALFQTAFGGTSFGESDKAGLFVVGYYDGNLYQVTPYTFQDVPPSLASWPFVEALFETGVTAGCGGADYCPSAAVTRGQMPVFALRSRFGASYTPPACSSPLFADVPCSLPFAPWINDLATRGVVSGCGGGNYCPASAVLREQMAVLVLRTLSSSIDPPACNPTAPMFADVPAASPYCRWIEEAARRGITAGCGGGNFCPLTAVTRGQMAGFLVTAFGLVPV